METLALGLFVHTSPWVIKKFNQLFGDDTRRPIYERKKICLCGHSKSGKTYLSQHLKSDKHLIVDLDDLTSYLEKDDVKKLQELKISNYSLYETLYRETVKNGISKLEKILKQSKKKLIAFCSDYDLAVYVFKSSSVFCMVASEDMRKEIRESLTSEQVVSFNKSVEGLLMNLHRNRPVIVFSSYQELRSVLCSLLKIQNKI